MMKAFIELTGIVAPLNRANVDTDQIIPKQFLKSIKRTGFGQNLFDEWRYLDQGLPDQDASHRPKNPDFILNQPPYDASQILLVGRNFGCGSSREHAPWALADFGFRVVIAPSFADIFYNNCFKNGILPITLSEAQVEHLFELVGKNQGLKLRVNLKDQLIATLPDANHSAIEMKFEIPPTRKKSLLLGLDDIGETLQQKNAIEQFERQYYQNNPWLIME